MSTFFEWKVLLLLACLLYAGCTAPVAPPAAPAQETQTAAGEQAAAPATEEAPAAAQESAPAASGTAQEAAVGPVAVLIVDNFGALSRETFLRGILLEEHQSKVALDFGVTPAVAEGILRDSRPLTTTENCITAPDGQGYVAQGAGEAPDKQHGEKVKKAAQARLAALSAKQNGETTLATGSGEVEIEHWTVPGSTDSAEEGHILLVRVPVPGFNTQDAAQRIRDTVSALSSLTPQDGVVFADGYTAGKPAGIVVNMSFAIVPCDPAEVLEVPTKRLDSALEELNPADIFGEGGLQNYLAESVSRLVSIYTPSPEGIDKLTSEYNFRWPETVQGTPEDLRVLDVLPAEVDRDVILQTVLPQLPPSLGLEQFGQNPNLTSQKVLPCSGSTMADYLAKVQKEHSQLQAALANAAPTDEKLAAAMRLFGSIQLAAGYLQGPSQELESAANLSELSEIGTRNGVPVILVAAAGNMGCTFPFAPALWPKVVSVGADDPSHTFNRGEVAVPTTDTGTSFAAPVISVGEAIYLLNHGGAANCAKLTPPLNDDVWDNSPPANKCADFK